MPTALRKYLYAHANPIGGYDPSGRMTIGLPALTATQAVMGLLITSLAIPQVREAYSSALSSLYQAGAAVAGTINDGALSAGTKLSKAWQEARAAAATAVAAALMKRRKPEQILYHYTSAVAAAAIAISGRMIPSDTFTSTMHKGAYATDVSPWTVAMTKKELSFGFYRHPNADVSWFVAIDAPDFYRIGAPYDPRVAHWVRAVSIPGALVPVDVIYAGFNPMP